MDITNYITDVNELNSHSTESESEQVQQESITNGQVDEQKDGLDMLFSSPSVSTDASTLTEGGDTNDSPITDMDVLKNKIFELHQHPDKPLEQTNTRFSGSMNLHVLRNARIVIIGAGGIGSHVVRTLVGMGAENVLLVDYDTVEAHNCGPQSHNVVDIGRYKVEAIQEDLLRYKGVLIDISTEKIENGWEDISNLNDNSVIDILITCVDNMDFRNSLNDFENLTTFLSKAKVTKYYIDTRMTMGSWNIFTLPISLLVQNYKSNIFDTTTVLAKCNDFYRKFKVEAVFTSDEQIQETCTERAIIYTGVNIASFVAAQLHNLINNWELYAMDKDINSLFYAELPINNSESRSAIDTLNSFINLTDQGTSFKWSASFNARTCHGVATDTTGMLVNMYQDMLSESNSKCEELMTVINNNSIKVINNNNTALENTILRSKVDSYDGIITNLKSDVLGIIDIYNNRDVTGHQSTLEHIMTFANAIKDELNLVDDFQNNTSTADDITQESIFTSSSNTQYIDVDDGEVLFNNNVLLINSNMVSEVNSIQNTDVAFIDRGSRNNTNTMYVISDIYAKVRVKNYCKVVLEDLCSHDWDDILRVNNTETIGGYIEFINTLWDMQVSRFRNGEPKLEIFAPESFSVNIKNDVQLADSTEVLTSIRWDISDNRCTLALVYEYVNKTIIVDLTRLA